jgi:Subtilase family
MRINRAVCHMLRALVLPACMTLFAGSSSLAQTDQDQQQTPGPKNTGATAVVELPALLIDLFRSTPPGETAPEQTATPDSAQSDPSAATPVTPSTPQAATPSPVATNGEFVPDEVLVTIAGDAPAAQQLATSLGLQIRSSRTSVLLGTSLVRFGIPDGRSVGTVIAQLQQDGRVAAVGANHLYTLQQSEMPKGFAFEQIAFDTREADGSAIRIGVIDTARDTTHPALANINAVDFNAMPDIAVNDTKHGTSIVGLIAGQDAFQSLAPGAQIFHARAFENGKSNTNAILAALDWSAEQNVQIINMSFVGPRNRLFELACAGAIKRGILLVAAAGNNGPKAPYAFPAAFKGVVAVTATDAQNKRMEEANIGTYIRISAPGVGVMAPIPGGGYDLVTGTSFAAAIYTGALANLMRKEPGQSGFSLDNNVAKTALDLGTKGRDVEFGFGLIDMKSALETVH